MNVILQDNRRYVLRFDKGEDVFTGLSAFADAHHVSAAAFQGIGACSEAEIGDFDVATKSYRKHPVKENLEIVSLIGNISMLEGKPAIHMHGSLSRADLSVVGGHIFKLVVSITCEIFLIKLEGGLKREMDSDLGLNLLI
jgi:uncharacterized protein